MERGRASAVLAIQRALHSARKNIVRAGRGRRRWIFVHLRPPSELILITRECTIFENTLYADSSLAGLPIVTRSIGNQAAALYSLPLKTLPLLTTTTWSPLLLIVYLSLFNALPGSSCSSCFNWTSSLVMDTRFSLCVEFLNNFWWKKWFRLVARSQNLIWFGIFRWSRLCLLENFDFGSLK